MASDCLGDINRFNRLFPIDAIPYFSPASSVTMTPIITYGIKNFRNRLETYFPYCSPLYEYAIRKPDMKMKYGMWKMYSQWWNCPYPTGMKSSR